MLHDLNQHTESSNNEKFQTNRLPFEGFLRLKQIIGDKESPGIIPLAKSTWWAGVKTGRFPKPIKLSPRITVWRISDIRKLFQDGLE